jgi:protein ImuB
MDVTARNLPISTLPEPVTAPTKLLLALSSTAPAQSRRTRKQTWLAVHFADWSLHAAMRAFASEQRANLMRQPLVVLDQDRQRRVLAANPAALAQGVRPGHTLNAALALCAQLQLLPRDTTAETRLLAELAEWAQRYTPLVSMEAPNELLLEVRGSLRLFGGVAALLAEVEQALQQRQLVASMALSSTAHASLCLARCARSRGVAGAAVVTPMQLKAALSDLPLACLHWPMEVEVRLARFGIRRLGELWRLPRADLARRIGVRYLRKLDALLGRQVELRQSFKTVPIYRDRIVLDFEVSSTGLLEQVLLSALSRLQTYLCERDLSLGRVHIELRHRERDVTRLCIGLATPTAEMQRVAALLHEQLHSLILPTPVLEIRLCVKQLLAAQGIAADMLAGITQRGSTQVQTQTERLGCLLERLQVRLGVSAIRCLQLRADHRPECAQQTQPANLRSSDLRGEYAAPCVNRPLWLLPEPLSLSNGIKPPEQLRLLQGPERIEAGWWNGAPIKRDYYVARHGNQSCWVFKDLLRASGWYVQGWFG